VPHPTPRTPLVRPPTVRAPLFVLAAVLCATPAAALQPLITDDTSTQGSGGNQLELSLNRSRITIDGVSDRVGSLPVVYTRGLGETVDLYAGAVYVDLRPGGGSDETRGAGNPTVGAKWRFLETSASGTSAAAKLEFLLPVSGSAEAVGLGSASTGGNLTLILSQDLPFGAIHVNGSAGRLRYRASGNNPDSTPMRLSAAPVWQLNPQWRLALDMGAQWVQSVGQRVRTGFGELGAIWTPDDDLDLALGVIRTADNQNPRTSTLAATAGLTWRFK
jgi:hypothetical protein